ncbi:Catalytic LigB subunit of aromatic ring-opening dioxygenase [Nitrospirillum viridazoti Y2]|nr:Catalytic LigB subunit of aromatic ring-opening dioxygenase [Nitrospirillum amazonense Y2]
MSASREQRRRRHHRDHVVDKSAHPARHLATADIYGVDRFQIAGIVGFQHRHQFPPRHGFSHMPAAEAPQPDATQDNLSQGLAIVHQQAAGHRHLHLAAVLPEGPAYAAAAEIEAQAVVLGQVGRRSRRAMSGQVIGGGADHPATLPQLARHQGAVGQRAHAEGQVGLLRQQVHHVVGEAEIDGQLGMARQEGRKGGRQHMRAEGDGGVDDEPAAHGARSHRLVGVVQGAQGPLRRLQVPSPLIRQGQRPRGASQQAGTQPRLQPGDQLADGGRRQVQGAGGSGKAPFPDNADEHLHLAGAVHLQPRHLILPFIDIVLPYSILPPPIGA